MPVMQQQRHVRFNVSS